MKEPINKKITMLMNDLIEFKQPIVNIIKLKDEYDVNEMKEILQKHKRVMIKGLYAGTGKTTAAKNSGYNVEFITPYNRLCQELRKDGYDSVTLNKLLNINIMGEYNKFHTCKHDISKYDAVCFDEILLYGPSYLNKIYSFMNKTDKKMYATGDTDQLQPFGFQLNNVNDKKEYLNRIINIMFPTQIILEHNKRLKTDEDKEKLKQIKKDIFNLNINVSTTMKKYFKTINKYCDLKTLYNISYFNFRSKRVNRTVQMKLNRPNECTIRDGFSYYKGLELICKKYLKTKYKQTIHILLKI